MMKNSKQRICPLERAGHLDNVIRSKTMILKNNVTGTEPDVMHTRTMSSFSQLSL